MTKYRIMNNQYRISNRKESQVHCSETLREIKVKGESSGFTVRGSPVKFVGEFFVGFVAFVGNETDL